jgi:hypothetical protein
MIDVFSYVVVKVFVDVDELNDGLILALLLARLSFFCIFPRIVYRSWSVVEVAVDNGASAGLDTPVGEFRRHRT